MRLGLIKFFLVFFLFLIGAMPAFAARKTEGTVPQVKPLQPPAAGVAPNVNSNIQYAAPEYKNTESTDQADATDFAASSSAAAAKGSRGFWLWLAGLLVILGGGYWAYKKSNED